MGLSIGIVGLPNVGKSTLFTALTKHQVLSANYAFATIDPNVGIVNLPDPRLDVLAKMFNSQKIVPATVTFTDIAGIVKGASNGEGLGNKFLANIRESNAILHLVRGFEDDDVLHVNGKISPKDDIEVINSELILADLQSLENQIPRLEKEVRGDKSNQKYLDLAKKIQDLLNQGDNYIKKLSEIEEDEELEKFFKSLQLLSFKPTIYVFNLKEKELKDENYKKELSSLVAPAQALFIDAQLESELIDLEESEVKELLAELGQSEPGLNQLIKSSFEVLGLQTFLTAGEKESRAWEIKKGSKAPQAAGEIHSDFEKGFIRAQVISYDALVNLGSLAEARNKGKIRAEGKDYIMQDGDVVEFLVNS